MPALTTSSAFLFLSKLIFIIAVNHGCKPNQTLFKTVCHITLYLNAGEATVSQGGTNTNCHAWRMCCLKRAAGPATKNKEKRSSDYNTHTGSVTSFSGQDGITPLYLYIDNGGLLLY